MRLTLFTLFSLLVPALSHAQGTVPTFRMAIGQASYTLAGGDPVRGGTTTIPTLLVAVQLSFDSKKVAGKTFVMDAAPDTRSILRSPIFADFAFDGGRPTQYADALLRATIPGHPDWHTVLGRPEVKRVDVAVPSSAGYVLTSAKSGRSLAIVDLEWLQREIFRQVPKQDGRLVIAVTHNTAYYALGDATVCCSWGTHGVDTATGNSFVLASYIGGPGGGQGRGRAAAHAATRPVHQGPAARSAVSRRPQRAGAGQHRPRLGPSQSGRLRRHRRWDRSTSCWSRPTPIRKTTSPPRSPSPAKTRGRALSPSERGAAALVCRERGGARQNLQLSRRRRPAHGGDALRGARRPPAARPTVAAIARSGATERSPAHRLLGGLRRRQLDLPAARRFAAMGRYSRRVRHAGPQCARRHDAVPHSGRTGHGAVQVRHRVAQRARQESHDLARRRRAALHARRPQAGAELRRVGDADRQRLRLRRHRYRF